MSLITIDQALGHLRLSSIEDARAIDLRVKMAQAEAIVLDYCNATAYWRGVSATWTNEETVPAVVQAAILLQLGELYRFRGDEADGQGPAQTVGGLSPQVVNLLTRYRDPVLS